MAVQFNAKESLFSVSYQAPFGGIDSSSYATAINPSNFVDMSSAFVEDNILKPFGIRHLGDVTANATTFDYIGYMPTLNNNISGVIGYIVGVDTTSTPFSVTVTPVNFDSTTLVLSLGTPVVVDNTLTNGPGLPYNFSYIIINDIQAGTPTYYFTWSQHSKIWSYDTFAGTGTLVTSYVGGGYLGLLDNQLLNFGGTSAADGLVPNRISWSAPGQYGQFQPYDIPSGTGSYAAGFNDLPATADIITGFGVIGTVGYIFRTQGITQMNPTGNGIQPFSFNHVWSSELGIGSPLPGSIWQYGSVIGFIANAKTYTIGASGLSDINPSGNSYFFKNLTQYATFNTPSVSNNTSCKILPYLGVSPKLNYFVAAIGIQYSSGVFSDQLNFSSLDLSTSALHRLGNIIPQVGPTIDTLIESSYTSAVAIGPTAAIGPTTYYSGAVTPLVIYSRNDIFDTVTTVSIYAMQFTNTTQGQISFKQEQLKFGSFPTVTKIGFVAALIDPSVDGYINVSIDGGATFNTAFNQIYLPQSIPNNINYQTWYSDGQQTLERPQLVIKFTNVQIAEVYYQGTLAEYSLI